MDDDRFDTIARTLSGTRSRRGTLGTLVGGTLGLLGLTDAVAKKGKNKKKPKKPKKPALNAFGCLDIGQPCRGNSVNCCSGICQGKKPKKGKKDKSTCVAHNAGACTAERSICVTGNQSSLCGPQAVCLVTTGNASFCAAAIFTQEANCRPCSKDQDCEAAGFGPGSACVLLNQGFCATPGSTCAGFNGSGTACLPPGA